MNKIINFEDFQFETIHVSTTCLSAMYVTPGGVAFTRKLAEDMGFPPFVNLMIDIKNKVVAIKACKSDSEHATRFSRSKSEQKTAVTLKTSALRHMIRGMMEEWQAHNRYHVTGTWFADAKAMVFYLQTAKELPPYKSYKKSSDTII